MIPNTQTHFPLQSETDIWYIPPCPSQHTYLRNTKYKIWNPLLRKQHVMNPNIDYVLKKNMYYYKLRKGKSTAQTPLETRAHPQSDSNPDPPEGLGRFSLTHTTWKRSRYRCTPGHPIPHRGADPRPNPLRGPRKQPPMLREAREAAASSEPTRRCGPRALPAAAAALRRAQARSRAPGSRGTGQAAPTTSPPPFPTSRFSRRYPAPRANPERREPPQRSARRPPR